MTDLIQAARELITMTDLPTVAQFAAAAPAGGGMPTFDPNKDQSMVIGSDVVSFGTGVDADFRQAITDSALFAQLAALHKVGDQADPMKFFDAYFEILTGLGWLIQDREKSSLAVSGEGLDVHQAVIGVIEVFLAPIPGAVAAVLAVLNGLHQMNVNAPFITLFNERSTHQKIGKFQFTYVRKDPDHGLLAAMAAFGLVADEVITQILFFKLKRNNTSVHRSQGKLSIAPAALEALRPNLAAKVLAYRNSLLAEVQLGPIA